MKLCNYCDEQATRNDGEPLCEKHYQHFLPYLKDGHIVISKIQYPDVPKIKCEIVYNRKYINRMVNFTTNEEYLSILDEFKRDVRSVKRKNKLYRKIE